MRVAIVGAGALGCVYGARLATRGGCDVRVIGREPSPGRTVRVERANGGEVIEWGCPASVERAGDDVDVALVCVRYEQLGSVPPRVAGATRVVVMTPMMPDDHQRLSSAIAGGVVAAMPSVAAYRTPQGIVRHWLPRAATTLIDSHGGPGPEGELVSRLKLGGVSARLESRVLERNVATTVSFFPLAMAIDVGSTIDGVIADKRLLALTLAAVAEGRALASRIGKPETWAELLAGFVRPLAIRLGVGLLRSRGPEVIAYLEGHFGRKLHSQNVAMAEAIVALAEREGVKRDALRQLTDRLRALPV